MVVHEKNIWITDEGPKLEFIAANKKMTLINKKILEKKSTVKKFLNKENSAKTKKKKD